MAVCFVSSHEEPGKQRLRLQLPILSSKMLGTLFSPGGNLCQRFVSPTRDAPCRQASSYDRFADLRILDSRLQTFAKVLSRTGQSDTQISAPCELSTSTVLLCTFWLPLACRAHSVRSSQFRCHQRSNVTVRIGEGWMLLSLRSRKSVLLKSLQ